MAFKVTVGRDGITCHPPGSLVSFVLIAAAIRTAFVAVFTNEGEHLRAGCHGFDRRVESIQRVGVSVRARESLVDGGFLQLITAGFLAQELQRLKSIINEA